MATVGHDLSLHGKIFRQLRLAAQYTCFDALAIAQRRMGLNMIWKRHHLLPHDGYAGLLLALYQRPDLYDLWANYTNDARLTQSK